jgi:hypothetical protein
MFLRASLIAAVIVTVPVSWAAAFYAQAPIAAPVISADDRCGDGWEWSKSVGGCIPETTETKVAQVI